MKKIFILCAISASVLMVGCQQKEMDVEAEKTAIQALLDAYITSVENEDIELYGQNMVHDPAMINFGAFGDPIIGWQGLEKVMMGQNEALSETNIEASDLEIHLAPSGTFAWATSFWDLTAVMGESPIRLAVRCSWVLEKQEGRWIIVHFHKSVAAA